MILGHLGEGKEIVLGRVIIGDGAIVGLRATIFPEVRIGNNARVAAGALVLRGTVIPDGETWGGVPARKISRA
jgi:acetyltransferase-like isoleucine patch superfamily enzyme